MRYQRPLLPKLERRGLQRLGKLNCSMRPPPAAGLGVKKVNLSLVSQENRSSPGPATAAFGRSLFLKACDCPDGHHHIPPCPFSATPTTWAVGGGPVRPGLAAGNHSKRLGQVQPHRQRRLFCSAWRASLLARRRRRCAHQHHTRSRPTRPPRSCPSRLPRSGARTPRPCESVRRSSSL